MKRQNLVKAVVAGLIAVVFIIPSLAGAAEQGKKKQAPVLETSKITIGSEVINREVIQILRKGEMAKVTLNIAGQPGVYYKIEFSETGDEESYALLPKGQGVISSNGFGSVSFDLRQLGKEEVYLKVTTSDSADFAEPRVMLKPLVLLVEEVKIKDRGWKENYNNWIKKEKAIIERKFDTPHRGSGGGAVRG